MPPHYAFGLYVLDTPVRELRRGDQVIALGPRLFSLLQLLVEQRHRVVLRNEILDVVWSGRLTTPGVLPQAMHKLRDALEDGSGTVWFKSVRGVGYRFLPKVRTLESTAAPAPPALDAGSGGGTSGPPATPGRMCVCVLPCINQTGDAELQWVCSSVSRITAQVLEKESGLSMVGDRVPQSGVTQ